MHKQCKYCKQCTSRPLQQNEPRTGEPPELKVHITYIALHLASLQSAAGFCADLESAASLAATTEMARHLCSNPAPLSDCLTCLKDSLADTICTCTYTPPLCLKVRTTLRAQSFKGNVKFYKKMCLSEIKRRLI